MASNSTRGSSRCTPGRISSLEGWSGIGMGCQGSDGVAIPGSVQEMSGRAIV